MISHGWVVRSLIMTLLTLTAMHMIRPMISYRALELGASAVHLGIITAAFAAPSFLLAVQVGRWVDRFGEPLLVIAGPIMLGGVAVALTMIENLVALAMAHAALGLAQLAVAIGIQTLFANAGNPSHRDARIGAYTTVGSASQMIGPVSAGLLVASTGTLSTVWHVAAAAVSVATIAAVTLAVGPAPDNERSTLRHNDRERTRQAVGTVIRRPGMAHAMLASLTVAASVDILIAYLPAYGEARGIPVAIIGLLLSVRAAASLTSRVFIMAIIRRFGRRRTLAAGLLLPGLAVLGVPLTASPPVLLLCMALVGFGLGLGSPLTIMWVANAVPVNTRGVAIGLRITANRGGQVAIPAAVGLLAGITGLWAVFAAMSLLLHVGSATVRSAPLDS